MYEKENKISINPVTKIVIVILECYLNKIVINPRLEVLIKGRDKVLLSYVANFIDALERITKDLEVGIINEQNHRKSSIFTFKASLKDTESFLNSTRLLWIKNLL